MIRKTELKTHFLTALLVMMTCMMGASAQPAADLLKVTGQRASIPEGSLLEKRIQLNQRLKQPWRNWAVQTPLTSLSPKVQLPFNTPSGATFRSTIIVDQNWPVGSPAYGLYDFESTSSNLTNVFLDPEGIMHCEYGGAWIGDYYYMVMAYDYGGFGQIYIKYTFNMATMEWDAAKSELVPGQDITYLSWTNTPYDKQDKVCYGYFYTADANSVEFGSINYATMNKKVIAQPNRLFLVLAIDDFTGQLYGIDVDGDLYKIDKKDGTETKVGATGVIPETYHQAADIDSSVGVLYWTFIDKNLNSGLQMVDLATGQGTRCYNFNRVIQFSDITLTGASVDPNAPGTVEDLVWAPNAGDYNKIDISFTMPLRTNDSSAELEGPLTYTMEYGETVVAEGEAAPGMNVSLTLDNIPLQKPVELSVTAINEAGKSGAAVANVWAGKDTPKPVRNLNLTIDDDNNAILTWTAPEGGVHNGYVDINELRYKVFLLPDNVLKTETTETSFTEKIDASQFNVYYYKVQPVYEGAVADAEIVSSNSLQVGESIVPPYSIDFTNPDLINGYWSIFDADYNDYTWTWDEILKLMRANILDGGDDWMISPPIYLEANHVYRAQFEAYTSRGGKMEMTYGKGDNLDKYKVLINPTPLNVDDPMVYAADFIPTETGIYHFGLHEMSNIGLYTDLVGFRVSAGADVNAPDQPENLVVVPGENGALSASISCTLPQYTISNDALDAISSVLIEKDGVEVATVTEGLTPGGQFSFVDNTPFADGVLVEYSVRAANENGNGKAALATVYVGHDTPLAPDIKSFTQNENGSLTLVWENSPVGLHNGFVDVNNLQNVLHNVVDGSVADVIATFSGENTYTFSPDVSGDPGWYYVALKAVDNQDRQSEYALGRFIKGTPVPIPFTESFADGAVHESKFWWGLPLVGTTNWGISTRSSDGDGGSLSFAHTAAGDEAVIGTRTITLNGTENPYLTFSYYCNTLCSSILSVEIDRSQSGTIDKVAEFDMNSVNRQGGWKKAVIDLSDYKNERHIIVRFHAKGVVAGAGDVVGVDNISITDIAPNDLAVMIDAPDVLYTGQTAAVKVTVANLSSDVSQDYTARLAVEYTADGEKVQKTLGEAQASALPIGEKRDFAFQFTPDPFVTGDITFKAEVEHQGDAKLSNNVVEEEALIVSNLAPAITDLTATPEQPSRIVLQWGQPEGEAIALETVTDDFENYPAWALDFGEWETYDGDGGLCGAIFNTVSYPNQDSPFAYIIFNPNKLVKNATSQVPQLKPHSGEQFACTLYAVNTGHTYVLDQDNWLISPELSGLPQTISFYAKSMSTEYPVEQFEVLYSTTDNNNGSFVKIGDTYTVNDPNNWSFITVQLPEGAKYFAIRDITGTDDAYMLMIDDVTFTQIKEIGLDITGYNIYVDGAFYKTIDAPANQTMVGPFADGEHQVYITVLYGDDKIESPLSNLASAVTLIKDVLTESDLNKLDVEVFTPDGTKVAEGTHVAPSLQKGVYVVRVKESGVAATFVKK